MIFVSIDDNEVARLRLILDDVFGAANHLATMVWQTDGNFDNQAKIKICHEYVMVYCREVERFQTPTAIHPNVKPSSKLHNAAIVNTIVKNGHKNPKSFLELPAGFPASFESGIIPARADAYPHYVEDLLIEDGRLRRPVRAYSGWSCKQICQNFIDGGFTAVADSRGKLTRFHISHTGAIEAVKERAAEGVPQGHVISVVREVGTTNQQRAALKQWGLSFPFPKPTGLIQYVVSLANDPTTLVLDSFAGSGTTGHAVLAANRADGGHRRFILVEMDETICRDVTAKRLAKVIADGPGGEGFRYCTLTDPLFDATGRVRAGVTFGQLAAHIWFTETGGPLPAPSTSESPLLGVHDGRAVYLLFNGVLRDKRPDGGNVLTAAVLAGLPPHDGPRVIYGEGCRLGPARLVREGLVFRQVPYGVRTG